MSKEQKETLNRFTTLINPTLLSNIKLVSYFTNQKLYEVINDSLKLYIEDFEIKYNTKIDTIISLQNTFNQNIEKENKSTNKDRFLFTVYVNINDLVTNFGISFVLEYTSTNKKECSFWFFFHNLNFFLFLIL